MGTISHRGNLTLCTSVAAISCIGWSLQDNWVTEEVDLFDITHWLKQKQFMTT